MLPQKSWSKKPIASNNVFSPKTSLKAYAYVPDVYTIPVRQNALIQVTGIQESFLCSDSWNANAMSFFYQSSLFVTEWESWPRTQNDDKQPTISKSGNSQITAHASVNDPLAEKSEWYHGKTQTQSVAFLQRMQ